MNTTTCSLLPAEEAFLQAMLWEESHLLQGPATQSAQAHGLSLLRCLEPANRLSPNLHGEALNRLRDSACPVAEWPWNELNGDKVIRLLWTRLVEAGAGAGGGWRISAMSAPVPIYVAIANAPPEVDVEGIFRFIEADSGDFETYGLAPPQPGWRQAAAFDYVLWLNAAGSAASIAALLWMAYEKFIAPMKKQEQNGAGIYIAIRKPDGASVTYRIDHLGNDKEVFIQDFAATVSAIQKAPGARKASAEAQGEIKYSGMWVRRK